MAPPASVARLPILGLPSECPPAAGSWHQWAGFASKGAGGNKRGKGGGKGGGGAGEEGAGAAVQSGAADGGGSGGFSMAPFESAMADSLSALRHELAGLRTGRASPGMLEALPVPGSSRGDGAHVKSLGTVVARGPQLLAVEVYTKEDAEPVARAIRNSPLAFQARVESGEVLVPVPRLTLEVVQRLVKLARQEANEALQGVRRSRQRAMEAAREAGRQPGVQVSTDRFTREVESVLKAKEKDLHENH
ncbi:hypothetical protein GPECTOR_7g1345 [Gonium pectorale]|uniref:Ribosome-recycling factor, chloroplastic n=1 Tax=Gonium pectorale TaxID=33097 RepID=A0A150GU87_GONPE|nr:hypothetical protein GPECTOR_7g1345 [Gonium pectorale]|eukprot:KXZ53446.1 hypothetical protein GPECTOR_7g1345 [Gonium pectorale]